MKNLIFIEQIFKIKNINNIYIVGNGNSKCEKYILEMAQKTNCNIYYSNSNDSNNLLKNCGVNMSCTSTQILANCNINNLTFDFIYISEFISDFGYILDKILNINALVIYENQSMPIEIQESYRLVYKNDTFSAFQNKIKTDNSAKLDFNDIEKRIKFTSLKVSKLKKKNSKLKIGIGILSYNHSKYILDCLNSVFKQKGNFDLKVVIVDDCSLDNTTKIIEEYLNKNNLNNSVIFIKNNHNKGVINSIKVILSKFIGTDYFTFCEGDDYWLSSNRISKLINYMKLNPQLSLSFNTFYFFNHQTNQLKVNEHQLYLQKEFFITQELIEQKYFIGNLSCCFYDSFYLKYIDSKIFELPLYDFFINTYYSTFGLIGHFKEILSCYRIHDNSFWSSENPNKKNNMLLNFVEKYNNYFNFIYDFQYSTFSNCIIEYEKYKQPQKYDLMIIDNIFPNCLSPFSYEEISNYLYAIDSSRALCTYTAARALNNESLFDGLIKFKQNNPQIANKVLPYTVERAEKFSTKLMYFIFKNTVMNYYDLLKRKKCNFVFELYPGGGFYFDDPVCDKDLKKIMSLKGFKKVIVTQEPVKKYLLQKQLCKENQIKMIFGVVMNEDFITKRYSKNCFYGKNKENCDIVFMAHRYNKIGNDKGYDLFISVAKVLCKKYDNIYFHVIGNYDKSIINVNSIEKHIKFYGTLEKEKFDSFFMDKDIILSPNRPGILAKGAFDGFPTASCTEAGVRKVVMVCSDELNMCEDYYNDNENIVIIKNDVNDIVKKLENLYNHPEKIEKIAENGRKRIIDLYSYDSQMKPRINLLKEIINKKGD